MIITKYKSEHNDQLKKLFLESRKKTFYWLDASKFTLNDFELETKGEQIFVATEERKVIGFISIWLDDNFIHHLYILESYQQKKVGSKLLSTAIQKMRGKITIKCLEKNNLALSFYKKHGFIEQAKGISTEGSFILMERIPV